MGRIKKLTIDEVTKALTDAHGLKTYAADALGVTYNTLMRYVDASQTAQDIIKSMQHKRSDVAKSKLDEAITRGESWAILYALKNKPDPDGEFVGENNKLDLSNSDGTLKPEKEADDTRAEILRKLAGIATATGADKLLERPDPETT